MTPPASAMISRIAKARSRDCTPDRERPPASGTGSADTISPVRGAASPGWGVAVTRFTVALFRITESDRVHAAPTWPALRLDPTATPSIQTLATSDGVASAKIL